MRVTTTFFFSFTRQSADESELHNMEGDMEGDVPELWDLYVGYQAHMISGPIEHVTSDGPLRLRNLEKIVRCR